MSKRIIPFVGCGLLLTLAACDASTVAPDPAVEVDLRAAFDQGMEYADVLNQGLVGVYAANGATVVRQPNGLRLGMSVPTPQPGTYTYAPGTVSGHPEVFTLWGFVFNYPDNCTDPCNGDDLGTATGAIGGVYNVGGHVASGGTLNITGRIGIGEAPFAFSALESPETAEIHLALAPHGALDPSTLPGELRGPTGSPACNCWWVSFLLP